MFGAFVNWAGSFFGAAAQAPPMSAAEQTDDEPTRFPPMPAAPQIGDEPTRLPRTSNAWVGPVQQPVVGKLPRTSYAWVGPPVQHEQPALQVIGRLLRTDRITVQETAPEVVRDELPVCHEASPGAPAREHERVYAMPVEQVMRVHVPCQTCGAPPAACSCWVTQ
jgi:hypothetical protein